MVTGGVSAPLLPGFYPEPIQTGPPPVPTDSAIVASSGNVSMLAIQTALLSEVGSIREYIFVMFSQTKVAAAWPVSLVTCTDAGQLTKPSGSPTPVPVMKYKSSNQACAFGTTVLKNAPNAGASWSSSFGTAK